MSPYSALVSHSLHHFLFSLLPLQPPHPPSYPLSSHSPTPSDNLCFNSVGLPLSSLPSSLFLQTLFSALSRCHSLPILPPCLVSFHFLPPRPPFPSTPKPSTNLSQFILSGLPPPLSVLFLPQFIWTHFSFCLKLTFTLSFFLFLSTKHYFTDFLLPPHDA